MSKKSEIGLNYTNTARVEEYLHAPEHKHEIGEHHGQGEHLAPHEHSRLSQEHSNGQSHNGAATVGHGIVAFGHREIAALAHQLWEERGCPEGSPDQDWYRAAEILRSRAHTQSL
jgi:hypothetical protein